MCQKSIKCIATMISVDFCAMNLKIVLPLVSRDVPRFIMLIKKKRV